MAFNSLIGLPLEEPTPIDTIIPQVDTSDSSRLTLAIPRPEIKIAHDQIKMAESSLKLNDSKYKPQLYVGVDGSYSSPGYDLRADLDPNYAVYAKVMSLCSNGENDEMRSGLPTKRSVWQKTI